MTDMEMFEFAKAVAVRFGIDFRHKGCDDVKGLVYLTNSRGEKASLAYDDEDCTIPHVFACSHEAISCVIDSLKPMMQAWMVASLTGEEMEKPEPWMFSFAKLEDKVAEDEITDLTDANAIIAKVKA